VTPATGDTVPKSRVRKKKIYTPPTDLLPSTATATRKRRPSPRWLPGLAVGLIIAGIAWLVTYYMTETKYPVAEWSYWNLAVGFGLMVLSLVVFTQWR
jgi:drug/metabolite transporter (DMT)-like permease